MTFTSLWSEACAWTGAHPLLAGLAAAYLASGAAHAVLYETGKYPRVAKVLGTFGFTGGHVAEWTVSGLRAIGLLPASAPVPPTDGAP